MKKRALLALLMVMTLLLTSCAIIVKDEEVDAKTPVLTMGDTVVTKAEVQAAITNMLEQYSYYYGSSIDVTSAEVIASAQSSAIDSLKMDMALRAKAKELGLDQLTEEETAKAKEDAQSSLDSYLSYVKNYMLEDDTLEGEALDKAAEEKLAELGIKYEDLEKSALDTVLEGKIKDYVIKDVSVPDEDVKADYDSKVASDKEKYENNAGSWASAANSGTALYYVPAGIRRVKQILLKFQEEDQTAIDAAKAQVTAAQSKADDAQAILDNEESTEEDKAQAETDKKAAEEELAAANTALDEALNTGYANLDRNADSILEKLEEDPANWDELFALSEDPGMQSGETAEKGYAISADMTSFDPAFVEAGMALESVGDVTGKIKSSSYGYYIIKYVGDETEGPVDYESVAETLRSSLLTTRQDTVYNQTVEQWVEEAGIKEDLNALKN